MLFLCKFCFPLFLFVLVCGKKTPSSSSSRPLVRHHTAQPFVPFEAIWAMGLAKEHICLISDAHMFYLVNGSRLGRYLPLYSATVVPLATVFPDNYFTKLNHTALNHAVILHREDHQSMLYFDILVNNRDGIGDADWLKVGYLIDLDTDTGYSSSLPVADSTETWLSTDEENTIFVVRSDPDSGLSFAKCKVDWANKDLRKPPDLRTVTNLTVFYTLCLLDPDLHEETIFLTPNKCPTPVQWSITTGFADGRNIYLLGIDRVYIFPTFLYLSPGISGQFIETDFDDFFWHHSQPSTRPKVDTPIGLLCFLIFCIIIFLLTLGGMVYFFFYEQNEAESDEDVKEKCAPSQCKSKSKEWMKFTGKKRQSDGDLDKLGSKMLPSADENQKGSLKTDWTEKNETRVKSKRLKGRAGNGSYSNKKKSTSNGKLKVSKSTKGGKGKLPLRKSPSRKSKSKGKRMHHDSSSQAVFSDKSKPKGKSSSKKASPRNKKK